MLSWTSESPDKDFLGGLNQSNVNQHIFIYLFKITCLVRTKQKSKKHCISEKIRKWCATKNLDTVHKTQETPAMLSMLQWWSWRIWWSVAWISQLIKTDLKKVHVKAKPKNQATIVRNEMPVQTVGQTNPPWERSSHSTS